MTPRSHPTRLLVPLAALALLAACSSSSGSTAAPSTTSSPPAAAGPAAPPSPAAQPSATKAQAATVTIEGFEYQVPTSVPAGAKVMVLNKDSEAHTLTLGGDADGQVVVQGGKTVTITAPSKSGSYPVVCDFHGDMTSELVVA